MPDAAFDGPALGIDLGGTKILSAVVAHDNRILARAKQSTPARQGPAALMDALVDCSREAIRAAGLSPDDLWVCGVGSPGPLDVERGVIVRSANLDVREFPLGPGLSERLGIPTYVRGDVRVGGYGEWRLGAGRGLTDLLIVFVGTGIGGCLIIGGRIVEGATHNAGEVGHMVLKVGGPRCGCGQRGCMEALASRTAIARRIAKAVNRGASTVLADHFEGGRHERIKSKELAQAYASRDAVVVREVGRAARFLGLGLGGLINVLGPQRVIVGGGVVEALGETYLNLVREAAAPQVLANPDNTIRIVRSDLGDDSGVLGATLMAREAAAASVSRPG